MRRRDLMLGAAALAGCRRKKGSGFRGHALVAAAGSRLVSIVDLLVFTVRRSIPLPGEPSGILASPAGRPGLAWVLLKEPAMVAEVRSSEAAVRRRVLLPAHPGVARLWEGRLWWASQERGLLGNLSLDTLEGAPPLPLAGPVADFDISPSEPLACATLAGGAVQFIDLKAGKAAPPVVLGGRLGSVRFRSDGKCLLVAVHDQRKLTVLDTATRRPMVDLPLAVEPERLWAKQDGGQMFVTGEGRDAVVIVYPYRTEVAQTSLGGRRPAEMADSAGPDFLFVSNPEAGSVTVFDISTQKVVAITGVGANPGPIVVTPDQQYALVLNRGSGDMAVIRIAAIAPGRAKQAPLFTMVPVGERPAGAVVLPL